MTSSFNEETSSHEFTARVVRSLFTRPAYYSHVTWVVQNGGKISSMLTGDLESTGARQNDVTMKNSCDTVRPCESSLYVKGGSADYDVTVYFSGHAGEMRGCELGIVDMKGFISFCLYILFI